MELVDEVLLNTDHSVNHMYKVTQGCSTTLDIVIEVVTEIGIEQTCTLFHYFHA